MKLQSIVCFWMLVLSALVLMRCDDIVIDGFTTTEIDDQLILANNLGPAIIISKFTVDEKVVNGASYDNAILTNFKKSKILQIPENVIDVTTLPQEQICIQLKKEIVFAGHPPRSITPVEARKKMGVAVKYIGDTLKIATFGEWGSKEGGAFIQMRIRAPETCTIVKSSLLYGEQSIAMPEKTYVPPVNDSTFWYTSSIPGNGWTKITDIPDTIGVGW